MAVKVQFQIGHASKLRSKKTVEGFTHDWELYVKGVQQADISIFVEKIIFKLHESFQKPKRVCSKPPYLIQESGYAGFIVFIQIYFRNRDEPKKVEFNYDLDLQQTGPPQHRHEIKTFIFDNPSEEYRQKLLKGGGVPVSVVIPGTQPTINNNSIPMAGTISLNHSSADVHKPLLSEGKKHKLRPDDARSNSFANLFGPPITKTAPVVPANLTKHSPDNKTTVAATHASHPNSSGTVLPVLKEKSSKEKDKLSEKSKERSEKRDKHHKQSPHKDGRNESKKSDGSKHEKREKPEEKSRKEKNRDKDKERERDKSSVANTHNSSHKRLTSPKQPREHSPQKSIGAGIATANAAVNNTISIPRPSSSNSGKLEEIKSSLKPAKDSSGENKSKESKQKESSSSSSNKKSKKDRKDKDKERDKDRRHEEREKQKLAENNQKSHAKDDNNKINNNLNSHTNNTNPIENKNSKHTANLLNSNVAIDVNKKPEKLPKQELFQKSSEKTTLSNTVTPSAAPTVNNSTEKKATSSTSLNSNSNQTEKDKRSHKHKKREKNKDKEKDRERDKERDKDKDKEREKDKDKEKDKELKKEKEAKEKLTEDKITETLSSNQQTQNASKVLHAPAGNTQEENSISISGASATTAAVSSNATPYTTTASAINSSSSSSSSTKSSKTKEKKSKEKSSNKEEKLKHKTNIADISEPKPAKQPRLSNSNSVNASSSLSTSSSSISTAIANAITNPPNYTQSVATTAPNNAIEIKSNSNIINGDSLVAAAGQQMPALPNDNKQITTQTSLQASPLVTNSDSSNSSFPDLLLPKQQPPLKSTATLQECAKSITAPIAAPPPPLPTPTPKEPSKSKSSAKEKLVDKLPKEHEKEKRKRRNSQAVNTFIEPALKQLKGKEQTKSIRDKSKSPSLRNTGTRASISADTSTTFLQPSVSPSSTAAAAPLPPHPSSAPSAAHSPALSATEAVGNAASATAHAATSNSNATASSTTNSSIMAAPQHLPLDYLSELQELHHKIMTIQDNEDLQHVVELIAATGCYEITTKTFDFDLCKLDRSTVQRLQDFFATSVS